MPWRRLIALAWSASWLLGTGHAQSHHGGAPHSGGPVHHGVGQRTIIFARHGGSLHSGGGHQTGVPFPTARVPAAVGGVPWPFTFWPPVFATFGPGGPFLFS